MTTRLMIALLLAGLLICLSLLLQKWKPIDNRKVEIFECQGKCDMEERFREGNEEETEGKVGEASVRRRGGEKATQKAETRPIQGK